MKQFLILIFVVFCNAFFGSAQKYQVTIDLKHVVDDKVKVTCVFPQVLKDEIEFRIPKIVPGTYSIYDFGRFISEIKAYDKQGNELVTEEVTVNRTLIKNAKKLHSISYWVEDSYDSNQENRIFEPAGTNIEEGKNFVLNTFGFAGYLQELEGLPYEVKIEYPTGMFGSSALDKMNINDSTDVFSAKSYVDLVDGPIMYCVPDTATFQIGGAEILLSVYSPNGVLKSSDIISDIQETMTAQLAYLGGTLPVKKYAFIIYLFQGYSPSGQMGALEHSYSSLYTFPEMNPMILSQSIRDISAHEFFHILTPLNIHSEEISDFDFIFPKMSQHLWLYEGVTEYAAGLAQIKYGSMSLEQYMELIALKIKTSSRFSERLPFTELSLNCLDITKNQYPNVYYKGALISMALDIHLRELSQGKYGIQELLADLAKEYGKDKAFKDDELFDKIVALTYPEIGQFFKTYVSGNTPLPYAEYLDKVGITYIPEERLEEVHPGHYTYGVNEADNRLIINYIDYNNKFGRNMGFEEGDIIVSFDGVDIDIENYEKEFQAFPERHKEGDVIKAVVLRGNEKGKVKKVNLQAKAMVIKYTNPAEMKLQDVNDESKTQLRKWWINK